MEFDFSELAGTIFVGAFFLGGCWGILHLLLELKNPLAIPVENQAQSEGQTGKSQTTPWQFRAFIFLLAAYGSGVILENISDKFVHLDGIRPWPFRKDTDLKILTLFDSEPTARAQNLATHNMFAPADGAAGSSEILYRKAREKVQAHVQNYMDTRKRQDAREFFKNRQNKGESDDDFSARKKTLQKAVLSVYFEAKGVVLHQDTYAKEMKRIQQRIDFSRSCAVVAFLLFCTAVTLALVRTAFQLWCKTVLQNQFPMCFDARCTQRALPVFVALLAFLAVVVVVYVFSGVAYEKEELEFNKRVFDYYVNLQSMKTQGFFGS